VDIARMLGVRRNWFHQTLQAPGVGNGGIWARLVRTRHPFMFVNKVDQPEQRLAAFPAL